MMTMVREDPKWSVKLKEDPIEGLKELKNEAKKQAPAYVGDKGFYKIAIIVLGLLALITAFGSIILVFNGIDTPEVLVALGSAAVGALVGLFAPSPNS